MTQEEIANMLGVYGSDVRKTIKAIYKEGALSEFETMRNIKQDKHIRVDVYNLEMIIAIAYRIRSKASVIFRQYLTSKLYPKDDYQIILFTNRIRRGSTIFN
jgi:hypothetical protein